VSVRRAEQNENYGSIPQNIVLFEGSQYLPACLFVCLHAYVYFGKNNVRLKLRIKKWWN